MLSECFSLALLQPPFTSDGDLPTDRNLGLKWQTLKTCFLSSLATACQRSFLLALSVAPVHSVFRWGDLDGQSTVSLSPELGLIARNQLPHQVPSWVKIPVIDHLIPEDFRENCAISGNFIYRLVSNIS